MRIIDCHCHLGSYFNFFVPGHSPEDMMISMDNIGVEKSCISTHMSLSSDIKRGNEFMKDTVIRYPERFIGFFTYNPHFPILMKSEIPKYFKLVGIKGIKIHQGTHKTNLMNPGYRYIYKFAADHRIPIMIHTWALETIKEIEEISLEYSDAVFIMGHFGAIPDNMKYAAKVIRARNNVYGDTTVSMMYERNVEWLIEIAGDDKVLFGTDTPFYDPRPNIGRILMSDLPGAVKEKVLGSTMERILGNIKQYEDS